MKIGVAFPFSHRTPVEFIAHTCRYLEDAGFDSLWVPEHVLFFSEYQSKYPYSEDGVPGTVCTIILVLGKRVEAADLRKKSTPRIMCSKLLCR